jgi:mRNA interferase MazF
VVARGKASSPVLPTIRRGEVWWVDFGVPRGSAPALRRPAVVVQSDDFNASRIATVVVVAISSHVVLAGAPGNVLLPVGCAGLPQRCVVNVSQVGTLDRAALVERIGALPADKLAQVEAGVRLVLGLGGA